MSAVERIMSRRLQGNQKKKYTQTCGRQIERENGRDIEQFLCRFLLSKWNNRMPTFGVNIRRSKGAVDPIFLTVPLYSVTQITITCVRRYGTNPTQQAYRELHWGGVRGKPRNSELSHFFFSASKKKTICLNFSIFCYSICWKMSRYFWKIFRLKNNRLWYRNRREFSSGGGTTRRISSFARCTGQRNWTHWTKKYKNNRWITRSNPTQCDNRSKCSKFCFLSLTEGCGGFLMLGGMKCLLLFPFTFFQILCLVCFSFLKVCLCGDTCEGEVDSCN